MLLWEELKGRPRRGKWSVQEITLHVAADHAERHIEQIAGLRVRLGKPIHIPRLLPRRLY